MPEHFLQTVHSFNCMRRNANQELSSLLSIQFACVQIRHTPLSGGYCGEVPPLPIPNREVKLTCADGTAMQCGRVGSRLLLSESLRFRKISEAFLFSRGFFFFLSLIVFYADCFFCHADFADDADSLLMFFFYFPQISQMGTDFRPVRSGMTQIL